jgi:hypothetical protein
MSARVAFAKRSTSHFAHPYSGKANAIGIRIRADDLDWTHGDGPEVSGSGESLLLALTGRAATLDELTALDALRSRVHH